MISEKQVRYPALHSLPIPEESKLWVGWHCLLKGSTSLASSVKPD